MLKFIIRRLKYNFSPPRISFEKKTLIKIFCAINFVNRYFEKDHLIKNFYTRFYQRHTNYIRIRLYRIRKYGTFAYLGF